ncbi:NTP transferase domain-containing protein [Anatilimnocola sp. NA78]|uniref:nucleotidyltransferase family protein n=1 Tax=Anatilimnocola sp. NA78 TaxID=3415683 RepID=UPI003CE488FA
MAGELSQPRAFAIIPAAGESRRMGEPKLLLPVNGRPLIEHTISAWLTAGLKPLVVVRPADHALAIACRDAGADVLQPPVAPAEMKISVQLALQAIAENSQPTKHDCWLLAPADMPGLSPVIIQRLIAIHREAVTTEILVPTSRKPIPRRGHPVLFPWPLAEQVHQLAANEGVKALLARNKVREIACEDLLAQSPAAFEDVDTRADYDQLR